MARTAITPTEFTPNAGLTEPAGTTIDAALVANGVEVNTSDPLDEVVVRVANTSGSARDITIQSGANPPALSAGQGDLVVSVPATTGVRWIGPFTGARFAQADGNLWIDFATGTTGTITIYHVPRTA